MLFNIKNVPLEVLDSCKTCIYGRLQFYTVPSFCHQSYSRISKPKSIYDFRRYINVFTIYESIGVLLGYLYRVTVDNQHGMLIVPYDGHLEPTLLKSQLSWERKLRVADLRYPMTPSDISLDGTRIALCSRKRFKSPISFDPCTYI